MTKLCGNCDLSASGKKPCQIFGHRTNASIQACVHWIEEGARRFGYKNDKDGNPQLLKRRRA